MKKTVYIISFLTCFIFRSFFANSPILLNAQPGWSEDQRLVFLSGGSWNPRATCCGDTVHLVWYQRYPVHEEIYYKRSTDAGLTWEDDVLLSKEDGVWSIMPDVGICGSYVHVIWLEYQSAMIMYRRSTDGGTAWEPEDSIVPRNTGYHCAISADNSNNYVVSVLNGILFTKSTDHGNSWQPCTLITDVGTNGVRIASNGKQIYIVAGYPDSIIGNPEILFIKSDDQGNSWSPWQTISQMDTPGSQRPAITEGDGVHVTWYDYKYSPYFWTGDIFYRASRDSGNTWEEVDSLTVMHRAVASDILAEDNNLHLVWEDDRHDFGDNFEIYYRMSKDLGLTWEPEIKLTNAPYHSYRPSLACGGGYLHCFWQDFRDYGNYGWCPLYYKRKDLSHSITESNDSVFITNLRFEVYPNPTRTSSNIRYSLLNAGAVSLCIYDVSGRLVKDLVTAHPKPGVYFVIWNKTDNDDKKVTPGVYFCVLKTDSEYTSKKVIMVE